MAWSEMKKTKDDDAAEKQQPTAMVVKMKAMDADAAGAGAGELITPRSRKEEGKEWGSGSGDRPTRVSVVRMPRSRPTSDPSLSLHVDDIDDHQSSRNLWQVCDSWHL